MREEARGNNRHGSCGMCINETVVRSETSWLCKLMVQDLDDPFALEGLLEYYLTLIPTDIENFPAYASLLYDKRIVEAYLRDVQYFLDNVDIVEDEKVDVNLIFEGAQGLGLDQAGEDFPHVTRSNTGTKNISEYLNGAPIDVYYVTRCYVTRHGAGPLAHEGQLYNVDIVDPTNVPNPWQGTLRSAPLDLDILKKRIFADITDNVTPHLAITCLDQAKGPIPMIINGQIYEVDNIVDTIQEELGIYKVLTSYGPCREDIVAL